MAKTVVTVDDIVFADGSELTDVCDDYEFEIKSFNGLDGIDDYNELNAIEYDLRAKTADKYGKAVESIAWYCNPTC